MPSKSYLMLRSARRARLEARIGSDAGFRAPCSALSEPRQLGITVRCRLMGKDQGLYGAQCLPRQLILAVRDLRHRPPRNCHTRIVC